MLEMSNYLSKLLALMMVIGGEWILNVQGFRFYSVSEIK